MVAPKIKRLHPDAVMPTLGTPLASGYDLHALDVRPYFDFKSPVNDGFTMRTVKPGERVFVNTGIAIDFNGWIGAEAQIRPRSGLGLKKGVHVHFGTIDADYTGELGVVITNLGDVPFNIKKGDRIAQLVFMPVMRWTRLEETEELSATARGSGGFGHTGGISE